METQLKLLSESSISEISKMFSELNASPQAGGPEPFTIVSEVSHEPRRLKRQAIGSVSNVQTLASPSQTSLSSKRRPLGGTGPKVIASRHLASHTVMPS